MISIVRKYLSTRSTNSGGGGGGAPSGRHLRLCRGGERISPVKSCHTAHTLQRRRRFDVAAQQQRGCAAVTLQDSCSKQRNEASEKIQRGCSHSSVGVTMRESKLAAQAAAWWCLLHAVKLGFAPSRPVCLRQ